MALETIPNIHVYIFNAERGWYTQLRPSQNQMEPDWYGGVGVETGVHRWPHCTANEARNEKEASGLTAEVLSWLSGDRLARAPNF